MHKRFCCVSLCRRKVRGCFRGGFTLMTTLGHVDSSNYHGKVLWCPWRKFCSGGGWRKFGSNSRETLWKLWENFLFPCERQSERLSETASRKIMAFEWPHNADECWRQVFVLVSHFDRLDSATDLSEGADDLIYGYCVRTILPVHSHNSVLVLSTVSYELSQLC